MTGVVINYVDLSDCNIKIHNITTYITICICINYIYVITSHLLPRSLHEIQTQSSVRTSLKSCFVLGTKTDHSDRLHGLPWSLKANTEKELQIRPPPLPPMSFPINYSLINLSYIA
jgi:hypothetical protein